MNELKQNEPDVEAIHEENKLEHTIGSLLIEAREKKGLSKKEVADALNLRLALIDDIEADDFSHTASTTYAKGYIKNYARFVAADPTLIQQCVDYQLGVGKSPTMHSFSRKTTREATDNRLTWLTYLIVISLTGMFLFWWVQKSSFFSEVTDLSKPSQEEQRLTSETAKAKIAEIKTVTPEITESEASTLTTQARELKNSNQQSVVTETETQEPEKAVNLEDYVAAEVEVISNRSENQPTSTPLLTKINLQLTENCWIKLEDASGKVLILGEKKAGYNKTVSGTPPFNAVFGAPQAVKLSLNNEKIDLSHLPKKRVARLTLPIEE